jgi:hypothetical protein
MLNLDAFGMSHLFENFLQIPFGFFPALTKTLLLSYILISG